MSWQEAVLEIAQEAEQVLEEHANEPHSAGALAHSLYSFARQLRAVVTAAGQEAQGPVSPMAFEVANPRVEIERLKQEMQKQKAEAVAQAPVVPPDHELLDIVTGTATTGRLAVPVNLSAGEMFVDKTSDMVYRVRQVQGSPRKYLRLDDYATERRKAVPA